jgi:hypothetical protein
MSTFIGREVFVGPWGGISTDLAEAVNHQVVAGQPSHVAGRPMSSAFTDFPFSCRHVSKKFWSELTQKLAGRPRNLAN